jgi:hypothetical protein
MNANHEAPLHEPACMEASRVFTDMEKWAEIRRRVLVDGVIVHTLD